METFCPRALLFFMLVLAFNRLSRARLVFSACSGVSVTEMLMVLCCLLGAIGGLVTGALVTLVLTRERPA